MGAETFYETSFGKTPDEAFSNAVANAAYEYGHSGYTGSIAEKTCYTMATHEIMTDSQADKLSESLIETKYSDKWGPAGCIEIQSTSDQKKYLFFGWASS